jgi:hypothetical protein
VKSIGKRPLIAVAVGLTVLVIGIVGWQVAKSDDGHGGVTRPTAAVPTATPKRTDVKLTVQSAFGLDEPNKAEPGHGDTSVGKAAGAVIDGRPSTTWNSETYSSANFGNYLKGAGVRLDMGKSVKVTHVEVVLAGHGGGTLELRLGDGQTPSSLRLAEKRSDASGTVEFHNRMGISGRYVLVWFALPAPAGFKAQISEITVYGQSG